MLTPTEMEDLFEKLDRRLDRIEQILPILATKDDLKAVADKVDGTCATKDDLKALADKLDSTCATKDDLKALADKIEVRFATKDDLKAFATKEDLKAFATKEDLQPFATKVDLREAFAEANRHAKMLHEDLIERIKLLGEGRRRRRP